jgi:DHA2 family multidrug resistance protein
MTADKPRSEPMSRDQLLVFVTALAGSFLVNVSGQAVGTGIADIQGGIGASADEASWLTTVFTMAQFAGIVCATPLIALLGLRRYMAAAALTFGLTALGGAVFAQLQPMIFLRALQGFAAGGFGPMAFVATFTTCGGPRLPFGLLLLALVLLLPVGFGVAASGLLLEAFGWQGLFLFQAAIGAGLAVAATLFMPHAPINRAALRRDWTGLVLLATALAASLLVLGQGTRLYWLDSPWISWSMAVAAGAWAGFLFTLWRSPMPVLDLGLIARRSFIAPVILNLLFRAGFAGVSYLVPQFLIVTQAYRPVELSKLYLWMGVPQLFAFPLAWWLLQHLDGRFVAGIGMLLFGCGALLAAGGTNLASAEQFRLALAMSGAGQILFLSPILMAGAGSLKASDGPTASLLFNSTTLGGTSLGVAIATELVTERQKFHAGALVESGAAFGKKLDLIDQLAVAIGNRAGDEAIAGARAIASVAGALRREAWVLSFNDGSLLVGALLVATAAAIALLSRQAPIQNLQLALAGKSS